MQATVGQIPESPICQLIADGDVRIERCVDADTHARHIRVAVATQCTEGPILWISPLEDRLAALAAIGHAARRVRERGGKHYAAATLVAHNHGEDADLFSLQDVPGVLLRDALRDPGVDKSEVIRGIIASIGYVLAENENTEDEYWVHQWLDPDHVMYDAASNTACIVGFDTVMRTNAQEDRWAGERLSGLLKKSMDIWRDAASADLDQYLSFEKPITDLVGDACYLPMSTAEVLARLSEALPAAATAASTQPIAQEATTDSYAFPAITVRVPGDAVRVHEAAADSDEDVDE